LNINKASYEDLSSLCLLTHTQINNLLEHIKKNGKLLSIYELQSINGFNKNVITTILPYIYVEDNINLPYIKGLSDYIDHSKNTIDIRYSRILEPIKNFNNNSFIGDPYRLAMRYRNNYFNYISFGFTVDKDYGEPIFNKDIKTFDFISGNICLKNYKKINSIIIGDYQLQFGQGLNIWQGFNSGKSTDLTTINKSPVLLKPYNGYGEYNFFRGISSNMSLSNNFKLVLFLSNTKLDGNVFSDSIGNKYYTSINYSGYHRTKEELLRKHNINELLYGGHVNYNNKIINIGITDFISITNPGPAKSNLLYKLYYDSSKINKYTGIDFKIKLVNNTLFGESSYNGHGFAHLAGLYSFLSKSFVVCFLWRNYSPKYYNRFSSPFSEYSETNENGFYTGINYYLSNYLSFFVNTDLFYRKWFSYHNNSDIHGNENSLQINYISKKIELYIRYNDNFKEYTSMEGKKEEVFNKNVHSLRCNSNIFINKFCTLHSRIEKLYIDALTKEQGFLISTGINIKPELKKFSISLHYVIFDTYSYNSRIYLYENDIMSSFCATPFYNKGYKYYFIIKLKPAKKINLAIKYSRIFYSNKDVVNISDIEIVSDKKSEIKLQFKYDI